MNAQPGYSITWDGNNGGYSSPEPGAGPSDNAALYTHGTIAFGSSEVGLNLHFIYNVNDGYYGNSSSWIPDFIAVPDPDPFIGLSFGQTVAVSSIAWGRDNADATEPACGGTCMDRCVGIYTLQVTRAANPDAWTAETGDAATGWATIGTVEYLAGADTPFFGAYLRHRFDVAAGGSPIQATGLRIKVSNNTMAIDEIEVNPEPDPVPPISDFIVLEPVAPYTITWDLNNGNFASPDSPAPAPKNRALSTRGTTAFGSTEFGAGVHFFSNVNDGLYGNRHSWIPNFSLPDPDPFIGLKFGALIELQNICWSRDNGDATEADCGGTCTDRALGVYTIQITQLAGPGPDTPETGDAATGWITIGTVNYRAEGTMFTPYLRHRFDVGTTNNAPVQASGLRIKVPDANTAIDELEINVNVGQELNLVAIQPAPDYMIVWDGNDGEFYNPDAGARSPENDALAVKGATAFGSSELGFGVHFVSKVNDGFYGNSSSWISANGLGAANDPDPFIGVKFGKLIDIRSIAWGRDNGDASEGGCGGTCLDRCWGVNTIQITRVADPGLDTIETDDPATGWITIGTIEYKAAMPPTFNPSRRHRFDVAYNGQPIQATGIRIKIGDGMTALDELEINPSEQGVAPPITDLIVISSAAGYEVAWDGNDGEFNNTAAGAAPPDNLALAAHGTTAFGSSEHAAGDHLIANANDGLYGNSHSWLASMTDPAPFIGLDFGGLIGVRTVAWGRDNGDTTEPGCAGGTCTEGAVGTYTLQVTRVADPEVATPETGDPTTGWVTIGTLEYKAAFPTLFNPHLRHRYDVSSDGQPVAATGIRIKPSSNTMVIDEIEVNPAVDPDQNLLVITPETGYAIVGRQRRRLFERRPGGCGSRQRRALEQRGNGLRQQRDGNVHVLDRRRHGWCLRRHARVGGQRGGQRGSRAVRRRRVRPVYCGHGHRVWPRQRGRHRVEPGRDAYQPLRGHLCPPGHHPRGGGPGHGRDERPCIRLGHRWLTGVSGWKFRRLSSVLEAQLQGVIRRPADLSHGPAFARPGQLEPHEPGCDRRVRGQHHRPRRLGSTRAECRTARGRPPNLLDGPGHSAIRGRGDRRLDGRAGRRDESAVRAHDRTAQVLSRAPLTRMAHGFIATSAGYPTQTPHPCPLPSDGRGCPALRDG